MPPHMRRLACLLRADTCDADLCLRFDGMTNSRLQAAGTMNDRNMKNDEGEVKNYTFDLVYDWK